MLHRETLRKNVVYDLQTQCSVLFSYIVLCSSLSLASTQTGAVGVTASDRGGVYDCVVYVCFDGRPVRHYRKTRVTIVIMQL